MDAVDFIWCGKNAIRTTRKDAGIQTSSPLRRGGQKYGNVMRYFNGEDFRNLHAIKLQVIASRTLTAQAIKPLRKLNLIKSMKMTLL